MATTSLTLYFAYSCCSKLHPKPYLCARLKQRWGIACNLQGRQNKSLRSNAVNNYEL